MGVDEIDIQLERRVYYAGEVVRGFVKLRASDQVKCRGLNIRCLGHSHVRWHSGYGKSRRDAGGKTDFHWQQQTLIGNVYRTGRLDDAGENAFFNVLVHGDGVMHIPCSAQDEKQMSLIVRVMDYDFGKSDDLLGEVVIDAAQLARSKQITSYSLTRNGKQEKGEVSLSAAFVPSVSISGHSTPPQSPMFLMLTVHKATGLRNADLMGKNDVYVQAYRPPNNESLIGSRGKLPKPEMTTILPNGESLHEFLIFLPPNAPGSAELQVKDAAFVRYELCAFVDLASQTDPSRKTTITVLPIRPVPTLQLLQPRKTELCDQKLFGFSCLGLKTNRKDGLVSAAFVTDRQAYAPGESVNLTGSYVKNDTSEQLPFNISLRMYVRMCTFFVSDNVTRVIYWDLLPETQCPPGATVDVQTLIGTGLKIPAVFPSFNGGVYGKSSCLRFSYTLEMHVGGTGFWETAVQFVYPILISAAPPYPEAIEKAKLLPPVVETNPDPFSVLELAHWGMEPCETAPDITGPEDGAQHTTASTSESVVDKNTDGDDEDSAQIDTHPVYVPHVNVFDKPLAVGLNSANSQSASSNVSEAVNIDSLLVSVKGSDDPRRVVKEWINEHRSETKRLLPEQVLAIMSAVPFPIYHPSVARELAAGISPAFTCQHTASAMRVCGYQKAAVGMIMAPLACDPQNKQLVLDALDFEYEKESVSASFRA